MTTSGSNPAIRNASTKPPKVTKPSQRLTKLWSAQERRSTASVFAYGDPAGAAKKDVVLEEINAPVVGLGVGNPGQHRVDLAPSSVLPKEVRV